MYSRIWNMEQGQPHMYILHFVLFCLIESMDFCNVLAFLCLTRTNCGLIPNNSFERSFLVEGVVNAKSSPKCPQHFLKTARNLGVPPPAKTQNRNDKIVSICRWRWRCTDDVITSRRDCWCHTLRTYDVTEPLPQWKSSRRRVDTALHVTVATTLRP